MNRINPLYIILLLVVVLLVLLVKLDGVKTELKELKSSYKESVELAAKLSELKKTYRQKLILPPYIASKVVQKRLKNGVAISSKNIGLRELNTIMSKVLNGAYRLNKLKIKRVNKTEATLYMEIIW